MSIQNFARPGALLLAALLAGGGAAGGLQAQAGGPTLKDAFRGSFLVGAALNVGQFSGRDTQAVALVRKQFNTITPENVLKWERVHPLPGKFDFAAPDQYVAFGRKNGMTVIGHTLVWHSQTPRWVFQDSAGKPVSKDTLLARMRDHIFTVMGRYKGKIKGWDVVNEALAEDGSLRASPWLRIIGPEFIADAFRFAHEADPEAELYYNDYSLENASKRAGAVRLVKELQAQGIPITGVGLQGHYKMSWPSPEAVDSTIAAFGALGIKVMITELDVDILPPVSGYRGADVNMTVQRRDSLDPYVKGLPDAQQQALAQRYGELFAVYMKHRGTLARVTFWGVSDRDSWLNGWPMPGRTAYPLLFDRERQPKAAFRAVIRAAGAGGARR